MNNRDYFYTVSTYLKWFDIKIESKANSKLHRFINILLWPMLRGRYMTDFWTTIGNNVSYPSDGHNNNWKTLFHEAKHVYDSKNEGRVKFSLLYLFPQILFLPALVALLFTPGLWWLAAFIFLLPWPAYWRMKYELAAYKVSIACEYWYTGQILFPTFFVGYFTGSSYYFMWPFQKYLRNEILRFVADLERDKIDDLYLYTVRAHMEKNGMRKL